VTELVLGPLLRYAGRREATVWVETAEPCSVEVEAEGAPACAERTFTVAGHHYALVHCEGLQPDSVTPYEVRLDGERVWPEPGSRFPPSVIHTHSGEQGSETRILFGSCRVAAPHEPPYSLRKDQDAHGREVDALVAIAQRMMTRPPEEWPHALLLLGDQVYADECSPGVREFIRSRRDPTVPPGDQVADYEEYTRLYGESWGEPTIRWLLSTVPSAMIFDDHDLHDDWNTSLAWLKAMRSTGWWDRRIEGAFMSYLVYQHWGNLSPEYLAEDGLFQRVRGGDGDVTALLRDFAYRADREVEGTRWSYCRDIGPARIVMLDSRAGRVLEPGARSMVDPREWKWIEDHAQGGWRHLLLGTSLPLFLTPALHHLEAWNEAVCDGAWGGLAAWAGEKIRQRADLEHWAAFGMSFEAMCRLIREVGTGEHGEPPSTIVALSGDVHHAYLAEVGFPRGTGMRSHVWQATCSPFRNPLDARERRVIRAAASRPGTLAGRLLARAAGVPAPPVRWRYVHDEPWFDNQVASLVLDGPEATFILEKTEPTGEDHSELRLDRVFERSLTS
jgi:phosphodiesterase/alkaline phosphatase D-like protein